MHTPDYFIKLIYFLVQPLSWNEFFTARKIFPNLLNGLTFAQSLFQDFQLLFEILFLILCQLHD